MTVDSATFREIFPEFASTSAYPDARVDFFLSFASRWINEDCWGDDYDDGVYYLTAHKLWMGSQTEIGLGSHNAAGPDQSKVADKVQYTKQSLTIADNWQLALKSSPYGLQYLEMLDLISVGCSYLVITDTQ